MICVYLAVLYSKANLTRELNKLKTILYKLKFEKKPLLRNHDTEEQVSI